MRTHGHRLGPLAIAAAALAVIALGTVVRAHGQGAEITGVVRAHGRAVPGATVRVQTTGISVVANAQGQFAIAPPGSSPVRLTAWAAGYYIAGVDASTGQPSVTIELRELPHQDNADYEWVSPFAASGAKASCQNCHSQPGETPYLPFDEWVTDAHGKSAVNPRFLSMYRGTDLSGRNQSPATRFAVVPDYGRIALRPDPATAYFGPGYQLDFPDTAGNCAACHAPTAAVRSPYGIRPDKLSTPDASGITCDFCHKVASVRLNPTDGKPYPNTPGVLSFQFLRPAANEQVFLGPLADVAPGDDTYSAMHQQSRFCAACHFGQSWGVQVYNSFGEWLDSPYSRGAGAKSCQDCHMPGRGATHFVRIDKGGRLRDPATIASHKMRGPDDLAFMQQAARLELTAVAEGELLRVSAIVTNTGTGHSLPTDHPARNVLLIISATDAQGAELDLVRGPAIPDWAGKAGTPGDYAGRPGKAFARILEERWTGIAPTAAYWNPTIVRSDTRIPPLVRDSSQYIFRPAGVGMVRITARLIYRRAFPELARSKGWNDPDVTIQKKELAIRFR